MNRDRDGGSLFETPMSIDVRIPVARMNRGKDRGRQAAEMNTERRSRRASVLRLMDLRVHRMGSSKRASVLVQHSGACASQRGFFS